jgi:hypothetical protein
LRVGYFLVLFGTGLVSRDSERESESESGGKSEIESWILSCSLWNGACRYA